MGGSFSPLAFVAAAASETASAITRGARKVTEWALDSLPYFRRLFFYFTFVSFLMTSRKKVCPFFVRGATKW